MAAGSLEAGIAGADENFAATGGELHAVADQIAIGCIVEQLHQPHRAADQHAADPVMPLVVKVGGQPVDVQRVVVGQRGTNRGDQVSSHLSAS